MVRIQINSPLNLSDKKWLRKQDLKFDRIISNNKDSIIKYGIDNKIPYIDFSNIESINELKSKFDIEVYDKFLHIFSNKTSIIANSIDVATITATLKDGIDNDSNVIDYTGSDFANIQGYGAIQVNFIEGISTIELTVPPEKSGKLTFGNQDSTKYYVVNEITIWAIL